MALGQKSSLRLRRFSRLVSFPVVTLGAVKVIVRPRGSTYFAWSQSLRVFQYLQTLGVRLSWCLFNGVASNVALETRTWTCCFLLCPFLSRTYTTQRSLGCKYCCNIPIAVTGFTGAHDVKLSAQTERERERERERAAMQVECVLLH